MCANDPIMVLDFDSRYLDANHAACQLLGYTLGELRTMTSLQINHASEDVWRSLVDDIVRSGARTAETTYYTRDGSAVPVEVNARRTTYRGRPAIISVARDISRRKAAEAQLVQHSARLASLSAGATTWARRLCDATPPVQSLDLLLREYVDQARRLVPFSSVTIALCLPGTQWLAVRLYEEVGMPASVGAMLVRAPISLDKQALTQALLLPGGSSLQNIQEPFSMDGGTPCKRGAVLPIRVGKRLLGVLSIGRCQGESFTRRDADDLLGLVGQMAVVIDNFDLLDGIRAVAISEERSRLGREMHDRVGQSIACASAFSTDAAEMLRLGLVDEATWAIGQASKAMQHAQADLRESIVAFRTASVEPEQWAESLRQFVHLYERQWGIRCELSIGEGVAKACGAKGRVELARILQEALTNVREHADTKRVAVSIVFEEGVVTAARRGRRTRLQSRRSTSGALRAVDDARTCPVPGWRLEHQQRWRRNRGFGASACLLYLLRDPMSPISVLVADDHDLFAEGLIELLHRRSDLEVVGRGRMAARPWQWPVPFFPTLS